MRRCFVQAPLSAMPKQPMRSMLPVTKTRLPNILLFVPPRWSDVDEDIRRLAAVMFTDLAGYSKLSQENEPRALALLEEHRGIVRPALTRFGGREVKTMGDGFLVEFASALNAVRCAEEIQTRIHERNETVRGPPPIVLRIGIHLGEVVDAGGDLYGNAVNVASRIEPFAEPGGICVSRQVYDQVRSSLRLPMLAGGAHDLKNIPEPVELYHLVLPWRSEEPPAAAPGGRPVSVVPSTVEGSSPIDRVVVLPFVNISSDASDEFFSDGMTEELIQRLAQVPGLRVVARTTSMRYKGTKETARAIGRSLGVGTVIEGSVRKAGSRVRITVQLIDASTEEHLWSSSYDQVLDDIFAIQDDISGQIVGSISSRLAAARPSSVVRLSVAREQPETEDTEAYTDYLHGLHLWHEKRTEDSARGALRFFERALRRDPHFVRARIGVANCYTWLGSQGVEPYLPSLAKAKAELERSIRENDRLADAHSSLALLHLSEDDLASAKREAKRAVELNSNLADPLRTLGQLVAGEGDISQALRLIEEAYELDPLDVNIASFLGRLYFYSGKETEALAHWQRTERLSPFRTWASRAEYYLSRGDLGKTEEAVRRLEGLRPTDPWTYLFRGYLAARRGDRAATAQMIQKLEDLAQEGALTVFLIGFLQLELGEVDGFFDCMFRAQAMHALPTLDLMYSPLFANIRKDPRYARLLGGRSTV
jgi:adenylate cyclase